MGKPAKSGGKSGKSGGKSGKSGGKSGGKSRRTRHLDIDADYYARCITDYAWCAKLSYDKLSTMREADLVKLNCGVAIDFKCDQGMKDHWKGWCQDKVTPVGDKYKVRDCIKAKVVLGVFQGCPKPDEKAGKGGGKKRAANLSGDASSSMAIWASVGVIIFLLICALIAWWYLKGDKKGAGRTAKGASKSGKSKMTTGKSKLGSRKSLGSKAGSRKGSQRSKVSQASKGSAKKSRRSGKKK